MISAILAVAVGLFDEIERERVFPFVVCDIEVGSGIRVVHIPTISLLVWKRMR